MKPSELVTELLKIVGKEGVLWQREDLLLYAYDGLSTEGEPDAVVFPTTTEQVVKIVKLAARWGVPVVARGAGTGLSGGSIAVQGGIVIGFSRMNKIVEIDVENACARVQPGVVNLDISVAVAEHGYYFAPDPSSQKASTIGGNVAENAAGPHTLASGVTANHVLGLEVVLPDGRVMHTGARYLDRTGYDLTGLLVGSEGTLGIVTEVTVKLCRKPELTKTVLAIFDTVRDATQTVVEITARGITPAALEMVDRFILRAIEEASHAGYPLDAAAVLLIDVEGLVEEAEENAQAVEAVCRANHAREVRLAKTAEERELLWKGRKGAFGAIGRLTPAFYVQDGVIPRTRLPEMLEYVDEVCKKYQVGVGNTFHAGDGNLHPNVLYDSRNPEEARRARQAAHEIIARCVELGGTITGEHGVGMEKVSLMPLLFSRDDLTAMRRVKHLFDPAELFNPGKVLPAEDPAEKQIDQVAVGG
jgi:glycolate oxidase